ncbi:hypothetical protein U3516DRAFT_745440 [Neocallimastix sp. 'constans']
MYIINYNKNYNSDTTTNIINELMGVIPPSAHLATTLTILDEGDELIAGIEQLKQLGYIPGLGFLGLHGEAREHL